MAALDYLRRAGLAVELEGERLRVTPADRITADLRQFVRDHRTELLAELSAANDAQAAPEPLQATKAPPPLHQPQRQQRKARQRPPANRAATPGQSPEAGSRLATSSASP